MMATRIAVLVGARIVEHLLRAMEEETDEPYRGNCQEALMLITGHLFSLCNIQGEKQWSIFGTVAMLGAMQTSWSTVVVS